MPAARARRPPPCRRGPSDGPVSRRRRHAARARADAGGRSRRRRVAALLPGLHGRCGGAVRAGQRPRAQRSRSALSGHARCRWPASTAGAARRRRAPAPARAGPRHAGASAGRCSPRSRRATMACCSRTRASTLALHYRQAPPRGVRASGAGARWTACRTPRSACSPASGWWRSGPASDKGTAIGEFLRELAIRGAPPGVRRRRSHDEHGFAVVKRAGRLLRSRSGPAAPAPAIGCPTSRRCGMAECAGGRRGNARG